MSYQLLGNSGSRVSELCLGTGWGGGADKAKSRRIYDAFRNISLRLPLPGPKYSLTILAEWLV
ncbi:hypothetical protein [Spirosoma arcticum]